MGKQSVIVVLKEIKALTKKTSVAPLRKALHDVVGPKDELLVLTILDRKPASPSPTVFCCARGHQYNNPCEEQYIKFLHQEISQIKEAYKQIFRPFYDRCKSNGVKFQVKISAGNRPKDIIVEEANNAEATWIVMDRCFAKDLTFQLSGTNCSVSLVSDEDDEENTIVKELESNPKSLIQNKESVSQEKPGIHSSLPIFGESEKPTMSKPYEKTGNLKDIKPPTKGIDFCENKPSRKPSDADFMLGLPLQLSSEVIDEIISGFLKNCTYKKENLAIYDGFWGDDQTHVLVKKFKSDCNGILKAEKQAALSMYHKNIMKLIGYHKSENTTFLVFPYAKRGTLDQYLFGFKRAQADLTFQDKMKIAIETAEGVRYMHEDCSQGPIAHGELQPCNIFLKYNFQPLISGFEQATWLNVEQASPVSKNRFRPKDPSNCESMELIKSDIFSFGVLLLRLFCRRSVPHDDKTLIEWARPLLLQRAFHELLDDDMEDLDMHGIYRVMCTATQCTKTKPASRPSMSEVISILKGEKFCTIQSSPSSYSSEKGEAEILNGLASLSLLG